MRQAFTFSDPGDRFAGGDPKKGNEGEQGQAV